MPRFMSASGRFMHLRCVVCGEATLFCYLCCPRGRGCAIVVIVIIVALAGLVVLGGGAGFSRRTTTEHSTCGGSAGVSCGDTRQICRDRTNHEELAAEPRGYTANGG